MPTKLFGKDNPGGRKKGSLNKTTKLIKDVFADTFYELQKDPKANLISWAKENPTEFYKLGIRLVPTQMNITADVSITDEPVVFE